MAPASERDGIRRLFFWARAIDAEWGASRIARVRTTGRGSRRFMAVFSLLWIRPAQAGRIDSSQLARDLNRQAAGRDHCRSRGPIGTNWEQGLWGGRQKPDVSDGSVPGSHRFQVRRYARRRVFPSPGRPSRRCRCTVQGPRYAGRPPALHTSRPRLLGATGWRRHHPRPAVGGG